MATPMWQTPRHAVIRQRNAAFVEIFKFALYASFPLFCMFYFGGPSFYNNHVKPHVNRYTKGIWADVPSQQNKLPADREELLVMLQEMKEKRRDMMLESYAEERRPVAREATIPSPLRQQTADTSWKGGPERLV